MKPVDEHKGKRPHSEAFEANDNGTAGREESPYEIGRERAWRRTR
jgi:hypothetical protein